MRYWYRLDFRGLPGIARQGRLAVDRLALLLVDFQSFCLQECHGFVNEYSRRRYRDTVLPNALPLAEVFRRIGRPIVHTRLASSHPLLLDMPGVSSWTPSSPDRKGRCFDSSGHPLRSSEAQQ